MKILRSGPPWTLKCECHGCHSLLLIEEDDITLEPSRPSKNNDYGQNYWKCPTCGMSYLIQEIPEHVRTLARSKAKWNVGQ